MIDTTIPRISLCFKNDMTRDFPEPKLPEGFTFVKFDGSEEDKRHWAEVLITVGFHGGSVEKGVETFNHEFGSDLELAKRRVFFIKAPDGEYIGTCTAWEYANLNRGTVHWLGVNPKYQKYGLGRAIIEMCMHILKEELPGLPAYLGTQTSSHKAICLYLKLGFYPVYWHEQSKKDYEEAIRVLKGVMREPDYTQLASYVFDDSAKEKFITDHRKGDE